MTDEAPRVRVGMPEHYLTDLGRFVMVFGLAEAMVKRLLFRTAGVDERTALAIFSGVRANEATSQIRRCYDAREEAIPFRLDALLSQFIALNNLRNDVLHHGIDFSSDPPVSSNRESVLNVRAVRETVIEKSTLSDAAMDCGRIVLGVSTYLVQFKDAEAAKRAEDNLSYAVDRPWHYRPRGPTKPDQGSPRKHGRRGSPKRQQPSVE